MYGRLHVLATIQRRPENGDDYFGHHAACHNCSLDEASKLASMDIASIIATLLVMLYVPIRGLTYITTYEVFRLVFFVYFLDVNKSLACMGLLTCIFLSLFFQGPHPPPLHS